MSSLSGRLEQCKDEYENLKTQKKKLEGQLQQLKRDLDSSQVQKRDLEGCLQIREFEQEMQRLVCHVINRYRIGYQIRYKYDMNKCFFNKQSV